MEEKSRWLQTWRQPKTEDNPKHEDNPENKDNHKSEHDPKNDDDPNTALPKVCQIDKAHWTWKLNFGIDP